VSVQQTEQATPSLVETLTEHERAWRERPLLRALYREWFELVASRLAPVAGATVELGGGLGHLREVVPDVVVTDVEPTPWASEVVDAERLPYSDGSVANLVLFDVFHHLPRPVRFLHQAARKLAPGGRVVLLEPYCSPVSTWAYRRFHHEPVDLDVDPFTDAAHSTDHALDSNTALPTLTFFRERERFEQRWPELEVREARRLSFVAYPLSGGFSRRQLVPASALPALRALEAALRPLGSLAAFRCLVVLERNARRARGES
jgi:SAM-dependent methyltransferase